MLEKTTRQELSKQSDGGYQWAGGDGNMRTRNDKSWVTDKHSWIHVVTVTVAPVIQPITRAAHGSHHSHPRYWPDRVATPPMLWAVKRIPPRRPCLLKLSVSLHWSEQDTHSCSKAKWGEHCVYLRPWNSDKMLCSATAATNHFSCDKCGTNAHSEHTASVCVSALYHVLLHYITVHRLWLVRYSIN